MLTKPRILINRYGALGDVLMVTPIVKRIYLERQGQCEISVRTAHPSIFFNNPYVANLPACNDPVDLSYYSIVYNLDYSYESNNTMHVLDAYEKYVFGEISDSRDCEVFTTEEDQEYVNQILKDVKGKFLILHMRNVDNFDINQSAKNLPYDFWQSVIGNLLVKTDFELIQIGSGSDFAFYGAPRLHDFREKLSVQQIKLLTESSNLFLSGDSGPAHIAATSSKDMIVLYTIAPVENFKPFRSAGKYMPMVANIECQGCLKVMPIRSTVVQCLRGDAECRNRFDPIEVVNNVIKFAG